DDTRRIGFVDADATALLPKVPVIPSTGAVTTDPAPASPSADNNETDTPKGVKVVQLRPVRTEEGYRSVYSDLTRNTPGSIIRATVRAVGEVCITLGLILLLFAAYEGGGKTATVNAHKTDLEKQLPQ